MDHLNKTTFTGSHTYSSGLVVIVSFIILVLSLAIVKFYFSFIQSVSEYSFDSVTIIYGATLVMSVLVWSFAIYALINRWRRAKQPDTLVLDVDGFKITVLGRVRTHKWSNYRDAVEYKTRNSRFICLSPHAQGLKVMLDGDQWDQPFETVLNAFQMAQTSAGLNPTVAH